MTLTLYQPTSQLDMAEDDINTLSAYVTAIWQRMLIWQRMTLTLYQLTSQLIWTEDGINTLSAHVTADMTEDDININTLSAHVTADMT